jgi:histidinol-phosphate aminotransferase
MKNQRGKKLIAAHVAKLEAYTPGEQPKARNVVKLNTNENPYPPSPACAKALKNLSLDSLRRYPDSVFSALRGELAKISGAKPECIFVGNGSDEVLSVAAKTFVEDDEAIGSLDPSYSLYKTLAAIRNVKWVGLNGKKGLVASALPPSVSLFLLTNPNAPTGEFREPSAIAAFAKSFKGTVIIDEAYADFARSNCMALATSKANKNIIVMRTFSKSYSLAGLRVGWCVGPKPLIDAMYKVKDSYNVDAVAQAVALAAAKDQSWMRANAAKVISTRQKFTASLRERGWDVIDSEANFVFAKPPRPAKAAEIFKRLRELNIFVRYFPGAKTGQRLRISIGTDSQMNALLQALDDRFSR